MVIDDDVMANNTAGNKAPNKTMDEQRSSQGQGSSNSASNWLAAVKNSKKDQTGTGSNTRGGKGGCSRSNRASFSSQPQHPPYKAQVAAGIPTPRCTECGRKGHKSPECWTIIGRPNRSGNSGNDGRWRGKGAKGTPNHSSSEKEQSSPKMVKLGETRYKRKRNGGPTGDTPDPKKPAVSSSPSAATKAPSEAGKKETGKPGVAVTQGAQSQRRRFVYAKVTQVTYDVVVLTAEGKPVNGDGLKQVQEMMNVAAMRMVIQYPNLKVPDVLAWDLKRLNKFKGSPYHTVIRCGSKKDQQEIKDLVGLHKKFKGEYPEALQPTYPRKMSAFVTGAIMSDEFYSTALDYGMRQAGFSQEHYTYLSYDKRETGVSINIGCTEELISQMEKTTFQIKFLMMGETCLNVWRNQNSGGRLEEEAASDGKSGAGNPGDNNATANPGGAGQGAKGRLEGGEVKEQTATAGALMPNQPQEASLSPANSTDQGEPKGRGGGDVEGGGESEQTAPAVATSPQPQRQEPPSNRVLSSYFSPSNQSNSQNEPEGEMEVEVIDQNEGQKSAANSTEMAGDLSSPINLSEDGAEARDQKGSPNNVPK